MTPDAGVVDAGRDAALSMDRCDSNRDCGGGEVCRDSFCRTTCASDGDCTAPLGVCDATLDYCVQCSADADCGRNEQCTANACAFYCREDAACDADEFCRMDTGACAARECETTSDCSGGFECVRFECVSIDPIVCDAGEEACSADNRTVLRCNADGTMEAMESCATDSRCVVSGTSASCAAVVCTAGEMGCTGDFVAFSCDATGTMRTETPCGAGRYCAAGTCMAQACVPGSLRCSAGGAREECDARGAAYTATPCGPAQSCSGGACLDRICTPGTGRCVMGSLTAREVCAADGLAWTSSPCADTQSCNPSTGACGLRICSPGVAQCVSASSTRECLPTGLDYTATTSCPSGQSCTPGHGALRRVDLHAGHRVVRLRLDAQRLQRRRTRPHRDGLRLARDLHRGRLRAVDLHAGHLQLHGRQHPRALQRRRPRRLVRRLHRPRPGRLRLHGRRHLHPARVLPGRRNRALHPGPRHRPPGLHRRRTRLHEHPLRKWPELQHRCLRRALRRRHHRQRRDV